MPTSGSDAGSDERRELLSARELERTIERLASQVPETASESSDLVLLGIPTRGVALAHVLAACLERRCGHPIDCGSLDPTFHRDDLDRLVGRARADGSQLDPRALASAARNRTGE